MSRATDDDRDRSRAAPQAAAWWRRHEASAPAARTPDPADLGTAFGLDLSMGLALPPGETCAAADRDRD